jgi:acylphosphatase
MLQRVTLEITGQVQGVFLRQGIKDKCISLGLGGYVKNTSHGSVEAVIEGSAEKVRALVQWIQDHPGSSHVNKITKVTEKISKQQPKFNIEY